ncbi:MAG: hypothetical protein WDO74_07875 [Pseudomonadota bacterium]
MTSSASPSAPPWKGTIASSCCRTDERAVSCYQLAAFQLAQPTVVISPLPAELKAQYEALSAQQLPVVCVSAELSGPERSSALARIVRGGALLVLLTPEALHAPDIRQALAKSAVALFVAEEAHCASEASHELRPSFADLRVTLRTLDSPPVMAITRVATAAVRRDIRERLGLEAPVTIQSPPVRENLQIVTKLARGEGRQAALVRLVERLALPGLVFCATPHDVDSVYSALCGAGIAAHRHHSGMTAGDRAAELSSFNLPGQRSVMVAVSAFAPRQWLAGHRRAGRSQPRLRARARQAGFALPGALPVACLNRAVFAGDSTRWRGRLARHVCPLARVQSSQPA